MKNNEEETNPILTILGVMGIIFYLLAVGGVFN